MFVDEVWVQVTGGKGGHGVTSFARQPFEPRGRPDGGQGGRGGDVIMRASGDVSTLVDYHHRPHRAAAAGKNGEGDLRSGADGDDEVLLVPLGTVVKAEDGTVLADLVVDGDAVVIARGGRGGRGNAAFRTSARRAPRFHEFGEPPQQQRIAAELKLAADVALVGFPNAGKSSIIARVSAAKPKIANYPFTTLSPNLGVVRVDGCDFVVADVPGLIDGASTGRGLGQAFLRHVERAQVIVHVLDCASLDQRDPTQDLATVIAELIAYGDDHDLDLVGRPALVFLNKVDADAETAEIVRPDLVADGWEVLSGSAVTGEGIDALRNRMATLVVGTRTRPVTAAPQTRPVLRPEGAPTGPDFTVEPTAEGFRVLGERIERWVVMTDLGNPDAVRYLGGRLARAGIERALLAAGARADDPIEIGGFVFDFDPDPNDLARVTAP